MDDKPKASGTGPRSAVRGLVVTGLLLGLGAGVLWWRMQGAPPPPLAGAPAAGVAGAAPVVAATPSPPPVTTPVPAVVAPKLAAGARIPFEDLPLYVGLEVEVTTNLGTVRRGVLTGASSIAINLRLPASEGGIALGMPASTISAVHVAPIPTETPATGTEDAQAQ